MTETARPATRWRTRFAALALEAVMVVFAVLVALGVEEWREGRQLQEFADRARAAVVTEMRANLEEFESSAPSLDSTLVILGELAGQDAPSLEGRGLLLELPEVSSAAWEAAQASQAASYLDYDWVVRTSRAYEVNALYQRMTERVIDDLGVLAGNGPTDPVVGSLRGRLSILVGIHEQVRLRFEAVLAEEDDLSR